MTNRAEHIFISILICIASASFSAAGAAGPPAYGDPIDLPENDYAADPSVIRVDGTYYMYPTTRDDGVECWSSTDLIAWTYEGLVWGPAEPGAWNDGMLCAPDVLHYEGNYYLYYSANHKIGVAVAANPTGPFIDVYDHPFVQGQGESGWPASSIDPHVFLDDDGSLYMYCTCYVPFSSIRVAPMLDPVTVVEDWNVLLRPGIVNWEGFLCEAPWMVKREDTYYLMYSGNAATVPAYAIGYATAQDPLGPFAKYEGNPILDVDWDYEFYGPGHNSAVRDESGGLFIFYHTKVFPTNGWERVTRFNELDFDGQGNLFVVLDDDDDDDVDDDDDDDDDSSDDDVDDAEGDDDDDSGCCG